eukprot:SAG11_NODE_582_length_8353_cov_28.953356_4_plen_377_part_00
MFCSLQLSIAAVEFGIHIANVFVTAVRANCPSVLSRQDGLTLLVSSYEAQLVAHGTTVVREGLASKAGPVAFVSSLLGLIRKHDALVASAFSGDPNFVRATERGLGLVFNLETATAKLMVEYADGACATAHSLLFLCTSLVLMNFVTSMQPDCEHHSCSALLKKGGMPNPPEDSEVEELLGELIALYRFLKDKDVFNQYYKRALAARLLQERSKSEHLEQLLVSKLKAQCGASHTRQVETMLRDVTLSKELRLGFETFRQSSSSEGGDGNDARLALPPCSVRILSEKVWPPCEYSASPFGSPVSFWCNDGNIEVAIGFTSCSSCSYCSYCPSCNLVCFVHARRVVAGIVLGFIAIVVLLLVWWLLTALPFPNKWLG